MPQYRKRRRYGQSVIAESGQQPGDEQNGTWPRERLIRMDKNFRERAISLGLERRPDGEPVRAA